MGCLTCRRRKKRCDERRPTCETCRRLGFDCQYPTPGEERKNKRRSKLPDMDTSFAPSEVNFENNQTSRSAKSSMTSTAVSSVPPNFALIDHSAPTNVPSLDSRHMSTASDSSPTSSDSRRMSPESSVRPTRTTTTTTSPTSFDQVQKAKAVSELQIFTRAGCVLPHRRHDLEEEKLEQHATTASEDKSPLNLGKFLHHDRDRTLTMDFLECNNIFSKPQPSPLELNLDWSSPLSLESPAHLGIENFEQTPHSAVFSSSLGSQILQVCPELDNDALELYHYFCESQATLMSLSSENNFRVVFAIIALYSKPVLYGVLAWAAFHRNIPAFDEIGRNYVTKTANLITAKDASLKYTKEEIMSTLLLIASGLICSGDVNKWPNYLKLASRVVHNNGELSAFTQSKNIIWLLKNLAYHSILASSFSTVRLFTSEEYARILMLGPQPRQPDTLLACCHPIFSLLAEINFLASTVNSVLPQDSVGISKYLEQGHELEAQIYTIKPDPCVLMNLSSDEARVQVVLFSAFQLVCQLQLYHSVLRMNSASLQVISKNLKLIAAIDSLLGTQAEPILILPLFISGVTCCNPNIRASILSRFHYLYIGHKARNIQQSQQILKDLWSLDDLGTRFVNWNELVETKGWHISFA